MKHLHTFESFVNEMKINKNMNFTRLELKTVHEFAEPHPGFESSFSYYEKIGPFGLSLVGGNDELDYDTMDANLRKLYSILPPGGNKSKPLLKGDFNKTFEIAIFDWEGEDVTDDFISNRNYVTLQDINIVRKKLFDITNNGYAGSAEDLISGGNAR
ncbi:hypothetical protein EBU94_04250 [bacterium]|jgi:hypothetical protein|nr:hypothetical protein [bacterium]